MKQGLSQDPNYYSLDLDAHPPRVPCGKARFPLSRVLLGHYLSLGKEPYVKNLGYWSYNFSGGCRTLSATSSSVFLGSLYRMIFSHRQKTIESTYHLLEDIKLGEK